MVFLKLLAPQRYLIFQASLNSPHQASKMRVWERLNWKVKNNLLECFVDAQVPELYMQCHKQLDV